jgi:glucosamine-6-phosphate deaminase
MLVIITDGYLLLSREAARIVASAITKNPNSRLGFATGNTPLGMYQELIRLHREEQLDFSNIVTFNLDEYLGLGPGHPQSYHRYMWRNFFDHVNIRAENVYIPDGSLGGNYEHYCEEYEKAIRQAGGIDLQVLGIGADGHIGFNEPTSSLASRTRVTTLTRKTLDDNRQFFSLEGDVPECAITMGIGTILEARKILLLAAGSNKAPAVAKAIEGPITSSVTASALQLHRDVTLVLDQEAAAQLEHREYYLRVVELTRKFTPDRLW